MRSKLIGLLIGLGLAAVVAPAFAECSYHMHSASSDSATTQQTAETQPAAEVGSN